MGLARLPCHDRLQPPAITGDTSRTMVRPPDWGIAQGLTPAATLAKHRSILSRCSRCYGEPGWVCSTAGTAATSPSSFGRMVAVAIRSDGSHVQVPADNLGLVDVSLLGLLRTIEFGIERVLVLITGSRREAGPRDKR